jgi:hypothetical protein
MDDRPLFEKPINDLLPEGSERAMSCHSATGTCPRKTSRPSPEGNAD